MDIEILRSYFVILAEGSLNKAAAQLRVSQPTLTRRLQALEQEIGGQLLERTSTGVVATATGQALEEAMRPVVESYDQALKAARLYARGRRSRLRVGYIASAAATFLNGALAELGDAHPEVQVELLDLSPGDQLDCLREGKIDLALIGLGELSEQCEFYIRRLAKVPLVVAVAARSELARRDRLRIRDLAEAAFISAQEADVPGHDRWLTRLCQRGGFRPRFVATAESLGHSLSLVVTESAVMLAPEYVAAAGVPGVAFVPLDDPGAQWELAVVWQRGRIAEPVKTLVDALARQASAVVAELGPKKNPAR